jgi:hypothetical protein
MPYGIYAAPPTPGYHPYAYYTSQPLPLQPVAMESPRAVAKTTLMLTGFPDDVKERELNNLLLFIPGYQVRSPTQNQPPFPPNTSPPPASHPLTSPSLSPLSGVHHDVGPPRGGGPRRILHP